MMKRLGGSEVPRTTWDDEFFQWWEEQVIAVEYYRNAGMEFCADLDLVLSPGAAWGASSEISILIFDYVIFYDFFKT